MQGTHLDAERERILRRHLEELADIPLLSDDEELAAAELVATGREAENELAVLSTTSVLDFEEIGRLRRCVEEGERARSALIGSSRRLVVAFARRHRADAAHTVALLAAGDAALSRAVDRYDPTGGLPFSSFARWWVERAMREVEHHPASDGPAQDRRSPADPTLLTALGHLHQEDCRVIELRLGLNGNPPMSTSDVARVLGVDAEEQTEREERALAKLRHPCTPGDLSTLRRL